MTPRVQRLAMLACLASIILGAAPGRTQEPADKDLRADLCRITPGKGTGVVSAFVASAASGFKEFSLTLGTGFKSDEDEHTFALADVTGKGRPALCRITPTPKGSPKVAIFIGSADSYFNDVTLTLGTPFPADVKGKRGTKHCYAMGDVDKDNLADLCRISPAGEKEGDKKVALFVAPGSKLYQGYSLTIGTCYDADDKDYVWCMADVDGKGHADLCRIDPPKEGTGKVGLFVATGESTYTEFLYTIGTELVGSAADDYGMADVNGDGMADLYCVKKTGTKSGKAELSVATADSKFSQLSAISFPMPFDAEPGHVYLMGRVKSLKEREASRVDAERKAQAAGLKETLSFCNTIENGSSVSALGIGQTITSANQQYELTLHETGNLILTYREPGKPAVATWTNNAHSLEGYLHAQADGNFVQRTLGGGVLWTTNTSAHPHARMVVQDDGNLVVLTQGGRVLWETKTTGRRRADGPVTVRGAKDNMTLEVTVSRTGLVTTKRFAGIKKQARTWRHLYQFTIWDDKGNALHASDFETLTIGSKVDGLLRPVYVEKEDVATYRIPKDVAEKAFAVTTYMRQDEAGDGSIPGHLEAGLEQLKRIDAVYKAVKDLELVKDGITLIAGSAR